MNFKNAFFFKKYPRVPQIQPWDSDESLIFVSGTFLTHCCPKMNRPLGQLQGCQSFQAVLIFLKLFKQDRVKGRGQRNAKNVCSCCISLYLPPSEPLLFSTRSGQRSSNHRQTGGGDQTHTEGTTIPCRSSSNHRPHKRASPARCLLETSKWWDGRTFSFFFFFCLYRCYCWWQNMCKYALFSSEAKQINMRPCRSL